MMGLLMPAAVRRSVLSSQTQSSAAVQSLLSQPAEVRARQECWPGPAPVQGFLLHPAGVELVGGSRLLEPDQNQPRTRL